MCGDERTWAEALLSEKHIGWAGRRSGRVRPTLKADAKLKYANCPSAVPLLTRILDNRCLCPEPQVLVATFLVVVTLSRSTSGGMLPQPGTTRPRREQIMKNCTHFASYAPSEIARHG